MSQHHFGEQVREVSKRNNTALNLGSICMNICLLSKRQANVVLFQELSWATKRPGDVPRQLIGGRQTKTVSALSPTSSFTAANRLESSPNTSGRSKHAAVVFISVKGKDFC